jgi:hypothetical protein
MLASNVCIAISIGAAQPVRVVRCLHVRALAAGAASCPLPGWMSAEPWRGTRVKQNSRGEENRTPGPLLIRQPLAPLSYTPEVSAT